MDKLRSVLSGNDGNDDGSNILQAVDEASTLGWGTRVKGFVACLVLGVLCSVLPLSRLVVGLALGSALTIISGLEIGTTMHWFVHLAARFGVLLFIVFYTFGNICSLASTIFLMGPMKQLKRMFDKTRALATIMMLACLVLTLCAAFWWKIFGLALLFVILQSLAFTWYGLSYIPFARDAILKFFSMTCSMCIK